MPTRETEIFQFTPPPRCTGCGRKTKNMTEENGKGWLLIPIAPGVMLYCCVRCQTVHTNTEALGNTLLANRLIEEEKNRRIITPGKMTVPKSAKN